MRIVFCAAAALLMSAMPASAITIDFEDVPAGSLGTSATFGPVTFSSPVDLLVGDYFTETGTTRALCPRSAGAFGCEGSLTVTFAEAVANLSLTVDGADTADAQLSALVTMFDGTSSTLTFDGFQPFVARTLSFGLTSGIRSVMFSTLDPQGFSFDDFRFSAVGAVPEPASWAMMIAGFGLVGGTMRYRRRVNGRLARQLWS